MQIESIDQLTKLLDQEKYIAEKSLATAIYLAIKLGRPLFLEGMPGVGKTEVANVLTNVTKGALIRLQCYEGIDINQAAYEWNYARQMLNIRLSEAEGNKVNEADLFSRDFLQARPLLQAIEHDGDGRAVLLIDEIDRSDEEFEAYLLEMLSEFQLTIPEIGTIKAKTPPLVVITSNRTREVHDALKRRCVYHWIDYPSFEKELEIVQVKLPKAGKHLTEQVVDFMQEVRKEDLYKPPGISETLDWVRALKLMDKKSLDKEGVEETLGVVLKYKEDLEVVEGEVVDRVLERIEKGR